MLLNGLSKFIGTLYMFRSNRLSLAIRSALLSILLDKLLRLPNVSIPMTKIDPKYKPQKGKPIETQTVDGILNNLFQIDLKRVSTIIYQINQLISNLFVVVLGYGFLINFVGFKMGSYIMALYLALNLNYVFGFYFRQKYVKILLQKKDKRMSFLRGVLQNLEWVKIRALENFYSIKIFQKREQEIRQLIKNIASLAISGLCDWSVPYCRNLVMVFGWTVAGFLNKISFGTFTGLLQILTTINDSCYYVAQTLLFWVELRVSIKRVETFFNLDELPNLQIKNPELERQAYEMVNEGGTVISIKNGEFCWKTDPNQAKVSLGASSAKLQNYEALTEGVDSRNASLAALEKTNYGFFSLAVPQISIKKGEMVMIIGQTNSGKSSVLYSMLGEMTSLQSTKYEVKGNMCFMDQKRFLVGGSISENITLGKKLDVEELNKAIYNAALDQDLLTMEDGLDTILGDTNDTVSGGQRSRINLARCFYQE